MEITIETTEQDYISFYRNYALRQRWLWRFSALLISAVILSTFISLSQFYLFNLLWIGIVLSLLFFVFPYFFSIKKLKNGYELSFNPTGQKTYKPFASGIEIIDDATTTFLKYEEIKEIGRMGNFVFILKKTPGYYILPAAYFPSDQVRDHFLKIITNGIANSKGIKAKIPLTFKPGYLIGIICLIPLIGAITGFVLIILGIVHYKDKVFVILGCLGILFTIGFYSYLFHFTQRSSSVKSAYAEITQGELNDWVKCIEFYRLQKGSYPDSLPQIDTKNSFITIADPLQTSSGNDKTGTFQYQKVGQKYLLFSVGKDGVPNTPDDIYPNFKNADTSKLGFIPKAITN
jgi:hypothetical protein